MDYVIRKSDVAIVPGAGADAPQWRRADRIRLGHPFALGSDHIPGVTVEMVYDGGGMAGLFRVDDRYVVGKVDRDQGAVCNDSCVEFFVHPSGDPMYFNMEFSCNGRMLLYHVSDLRAGLFEPMPEEALGMIVRKSSFGGMVSREIETPAAWTLSFFVPWDFFRRYSVLEGGIPGQVWEGNFSKCADRSSHPHWLTWRNLSRYDFHLPGEFGKIGFEI